MKRLITLTLAISALCILCGAGTASAQKMGYIDTRELIEVMPEMNDVEQKLQAYQEELSGMLESIQVEYNNKYLEYQKSLSTMTDSMRQLKEKELQDLQTRFSEFQQSAQQEMQRMQNELFAPVFERARNAIQSVAKIQQLIVVYDLSSGALVYHDEANMVDVLPLVKKELGIE